MKSKWSRKFDCCQECGSTENPYRSKGLCTICYDTAWRRTKGQIDKKQVCEHQFIDGVELAFCRHCSMWKPITDFTKGLRRRDGLKSFCRDCENKYYRGKRGNVDKKQYLRQKQRVDERKQRTLTQQGGGCHFCGVIFDVMNVYDFHHIDPNQKEYWIASILGRANSTWVKESKKCVLICAICHRLVHKFVRRKNNYDNIPYSISRRQDVERRSSRVQERKLLILNQQNGCLHCGLNYQDARLYDFHHSDPSVKEGSVSSMMAYANEKWKEEVQKCALICVNCHRLIHAEVDVKEKCKKVVINENLFCSTR
jgi:hypothetical protein